MIRYGSPYYGTPFNVRIGDKKIRVGVSHESQKDLILDPKFDLRIRKLLKGEDYTLKFPDPDLTKLIVNNRWYSSSLVSPVILTLFQVSWREEKEQGLITTRPEGFFRYKVKCNGKELKIWYDKERNLLSREDFELLSSEYPGRRFMIAIGIDTKHIPRFPKNFTQKQIYI